MPERVFTESQANELLPRIRALLDRLGDAPPGAGEPIPAARASGNGSAARGTEFARWRERADAVLTGLDRLGVVVRDLGSGLIDFPAIRDGQPIFLCWRRGEDRITHWHDRESGFSGRRPL